ncbi:hypothetical protein GCM10028811_37380 [Uliginosibacterium sediminicola]
MISQRQQIDAVTHGALHKLGRTEESVGKVRMRVQISVEGCGHRQDRQVERRERSPMIAKA